MAIPEGLVSIARNSGVARALLDIAAEKNLDPRVIRTSTHHGYLVPEAVAEAYEAKLLEDSKAESKPKAKRQTAAQKKAAAEKTAAEEVASKDEGAKPESKEDATADAVGEKE